MYRYLPFAERIRTADIGSYISFGINVLDTSGRKIVSVSDVSTDEDLVTALCNKCTLYQLQPVHLLDVIEDSIP